ncbi:hypothetical protein CDCA_CDCA15G3970 [Cyanidium caldarium]|uniref:Uncharacterized protein n=1 Tax=Cyanidium caldarium TaxID=2771 RepID=A0AAV9J0U7_CYACA|nr:hypothetical protein CDCA_CDCA15G3970 [Cyanidium caldarium]
MFYAPPVLTKKGPLAKVWLAATFHVKLTKTQVFSTDVTESCRKIAAPDFPMALRLTSSLLLGVSRIHNRQAHYVLCEASDAVAKIRWAFRAAGGAGSTATASATEGGWHAHASTATVAALAAITLGSVVAGASAGGGLTVGDPQQQELLAQHLAALLLGITDSADGGGDAALSPLLPVADGERGRRWQRPSLLHCAAEEAITLRGSPFRHSLGSAAGTDALLEVEVARRDSGAPAAAAPVPYLPSFTPASDRKELQAGTPEMARDASVALAPPAWPSPVGDQFTPAPMDLSFAESDDAAKTPAAQRSAIPGAAASATTPEALNRSERAPARRRRAPAAASVDNATELAGHVIRRALADSSDLVRAPVTDEMPGAVSMSAVAVTQLLQQMLPLADTFPAPALRQAWNAWVSPLSIAAVDEPQSVDVSLPSPAPAQTSLLADQSDMLAGMGGDAMASPPWSHSPFSVAAAPKSRLDEIAEAPSAPDTHAHWSIRTARLHDYLQSVAAAAAAAEDGASAPATVTLLPLLHREQCSRRTVARTLYELAVLASSGAIRVSQPQPYGDIVAQFGAAAAAA